MSQEPSYRWLDLKHNDLVFFHLPGRVPWPAESPVPEERKTLNFETLRDGLERVRREGREPVPPDFDRLNPILDGMEEMQAAFERGDLDAAEAALAGIARLDPQCPAMLFNRAFVHKQRGRIYDAVVDYQMTSVLMPDLENVWLFLGELCDELDDKDSAIAAYRCAQKASPNDVRVLDALARLGAMRKMSMQDPKGNWHDRYVELDEFRRTVAREIAEMAKESDAPKLKLMLEQLCHDEEGELAVLAAKKYRNCQPDDPAGICLQADALRSAGQFDQAKQILERRLREHPGHAEAHYVLAWVHFKQQDNDRGWACIADALKADPNHYKAVMLHFRVKPGDADEEKETELCAWGEAQRSGQAFLIASLMARERGNARLCLERLSKAHEFQPDDRNIVIAYASELGKCNEREWMAALIHPRVKADKKDHLLKYAFAGALNALGLKEQAITTLREILDIGRDLPPDAKQHTIEYLDILEGRLAPSEIDLELIPGKEAVLARALLLVGADGKRGLVFGGGHALPAHKLLPIQKKSPSESTVLEFEQASVSDDPPALRLGAFHVSGIDPARLATEPLQLFIDVKKIGKLYVGAEQGKRKLSVSWSLYPPPLGE